MDPGSNETVGIVGVCGGLSPKGMTKMALEVALKGAAQQGADVRMLELRDYDLVFLGQVPEEEYPSDVFKLREEIKNAHGVILATPEYHGSLSGALKNMFDLMGSDQFHAKIVGLVGVAGGHTGAIQSLNAMRTIGRNLHCWVLPEQVSVAEAGSVFNEDGTMNDADEERRLLHLGGQVARLATLQQNIQRDEFMKSWAGLSRW